MYGLYVRWPGGRFVLMHRGPQAECQWMMDYMIDNGTDADDVVVMQLSVSCRA